MLTLGHTPVGGSEQGADSSGTETLETIVARESSQHSGYCIWEFLDAFPMLGAASKAREKNFLSSVSSKSLRRRHSRHVRTVHKTA